jgi:hypothetical protein
VTPISKKAQLEEIVKCGKDPVHFINNYCKIQHPKRGMIPFKMYPFQDDCIHQFKTNRFNIIVKSRQLGISTVSAAYVAWYALLHRDKNILIIATKLQVAQNFIKKVKLILQYLPTWLKISEWTENAQQIKFENGSQVQAIPTGPNAGRSEALSLLVIDEAAHIQNFDDIWTSIYPTLNLGGDAIILSTPNGAAGQYYQIFKDAQGKLNEFNPIVLPWNVHPEHDDKWFEKESRQFNRRQINQEFLCQFVGSGELMLAQDEIDWLIQTSIKPPKMDGPGDSIWVWHEPMEGHRYIMPADISRGDANDASTFHIIDVDDKNVAVEFKGFIPPDRMGDLMFAWGQRYNDALLIPENNTYGYTTCMRLQGLRCNHLYYPGMTAEDYKTYVPAVREVPGFSTQKNSREQSLVKMEEFLRNRMVQPFSTRLLAEFQTFVYMGEKPQAMKGEHDDLIMSLAIGCWVMDKLFGLKGQVKDRAVLANGGIIMSTQNLANVPGSGYEVKSLIRPSMIMMTPLYSNKADVERQKQIYQQYADLLR